MNYKLDADRLRARPSNIWRFYLSNENTATLDLRDFEVYSGMLRGNDREGQRRIKPTKNILFVFPAEKIPDVEPHIEKAQPSKSVTKMRLNKGELRQALKENIVLTMRGGYVIRGKLQKFDDYRLFMRVGNTEVQVYRHGLLKLKKETVPNQIESNDRNETRQKRQPEHVEANRSKKEKVLSQTKTNDLHELRKIREEWVELSRENSFEEGIKGLLTDLYPDKAHFIYELLQNAEDAGASEVRFTLEMDKLKFEHNGDQLFTIDDIKSITNFGSSTKAEDSTSIGKFGIGFKAVFAYTTTPEIESGKYHFRIRDMVVPDTEGLAPGALGERKTHFVFPFDNPEKPPDKARAEIEKNLRRLNESTLLFLSNIRKIEYHLPDGSGSGYLERREKEQDRNRIEIAVKRPEDLTPNSTHYFRFEKIVSVRDEEDGELKDCRIAVAFGMELRDGRGWKITPLNPGQVCIYFPAIKETSKLLFHLHAPFASTVARDSVRECRANTELLKHLATLIAESMSAIRDQGLLNVEFLAVLPNDTDNLSADYLPIQKQLIQTFNNEKLTPMKQGGHAAASGLYRGSQELSDLIQDEDLARLLGKDKSSPLWVAPPRPIQKRDEKGQYASDTNAQRIRNFLTMLAISEWTVEDFIEALKVRGDIAMEWMQVKPDDWHQRLYALLGDFLSSTSPYSYQTRERKEKLLPLSIVRCKDGNYRTGGQCHFPTGDAEFEADLLRVTTGIEAENTPSTKEDNEHIEDFHYVAKGIHTSGQNRDQQEKARKFLETIGVREVDETERIKMILKRRYMSESFKPDEADLERFIKLVETDSSKAELFKSYSIFEVDLERDNTRWFYKPSSVFIDSPYLETGLAAYYETMEEDSNRRRTLSPKYAQFEIDPERLGKFAAAVGAQTQLQAFEQEIPTDHPEWKTNLSQASGQRQTNTTIDQDYTILEFDVLYNPPSIVKAKLIWRTMCSLPERYLKARFRWNQSNDLRTAHSSLVHNLRRAKWVPQKEGDSVSFAFPREASVERLPEGFPYEAEQKWLQAIEFGKIAREQKVEYLQQNQRAQEMGFSSGDEVETMVELAKVLRAQGKSPEEMIDRLNTEKRRAERLTIQLTDAEEKQYEIRARSIRSTRSTIDPHTPLRQQYTKFNNMECQMCRQNMPFKKRNSDEDYFEAVEAFGKDYFPKEHEAQHLALCPECAAKYKEYVKKDKVARKSLHNLLKDSDEPEVRLELSDFAIRIWFDKKHWHDLKTVLHYYENVHEDENSTD